ncbi:unnamed protein product [Burkholderia pseudomallei]|nr:unnamed protein product [Burkholderia pseudomallei]
MNLAALGGLFALTPASLFRHDALGGSIGPALSLPIFDRSRLKAKLGGDVANADMALALYNQTVDAALGEVARQLTSLATLDTLLKAQQQALRAAQRMVALAQDRHRRGWGCARTSTWRSSRCWTSAHTWWSCRRGGARCGWADRRAGRRLRRAAGERRAARAGGPAVRGGVAAGGGARCAT